MCTKMIFFLISLIGILLPVSSGMINVDFLSEYLKQKNINQIVTFACWDDFDTIDYFRDAVDRGMRISYNGINDVLDLKKILKVNYHKIGVILDLDCELSWSIFDKFSEARLPFNESYNWIAVTTKTEIPAAELSQLPLTVESELTLAMAKKSTYILYDVYNHSYRHGGKLNITTMGYWNVENGLKNELTQYKYKRRQDFHGIPLNISTVIFEKPELDLETYLMNPHNPHLDTWSRFHYALALYLADIYNFKINLKVDRSWGYMVNGTFNGVIGDMIKGVIDIGATSFRYNAQRMDYSDYTVETYTARLYFYFRHPKKSNVTNPFLKPFHTNVWLVAATYGILISILLMINSKVEDRYKSLLSRKIYTNAPVEEVFLTVSAVSQQGSSMEPRLLSGRIMFLALFIWSSMMYEFYSAQIVGSLLTPPPKLINNLYDLADSDLHVAFDGQPYTLDHLKTTPDPACIYLREKKMKPPLKKELYPNPQDGLRQVREGGYAYFMGASTAYKMIEETFTQDEICELSLSEISLVPPLPLSMVTSKHSPFKKMVIYGLRQMVQHGLTNRLYKIWNHRRPSCPESFRSKPVPVEIGEFSAALFMMAAGFIMAMFIIVGEKLIHYIKCIESENNTRFDVEPIETSSLSLIEPI